MAKEKQSAAAPKRKSNKPAKVRADPAADSQPDEDVPAEAVAAHVEAPQQPADEARQPENAASGAPKKNARSPAARGNRGGRGGRGGDRGGRGGVRGGRGSARGGRGADRGGRGGAHGRADGFKRPEKPKHGPPTGRPTVQQIMEDELTKTSAQYWAPGSAAPTKGHFKPDLVDRIYNQDMNKAAPRGGGSGGEDGGGSSSPAARLQLLEFSSYLEAYLWPHFDPANASIEHLMSIILMFNEKFKEGVDVWGSLASAPAGAPTPSGDDAETPAARKGRGYDATATAEGATDALSSSFGAFLECCAGLQLGEWPAEASKRRALTIHERTAFIKFLVNSFQELEQPAVRAAALRLVSLPLWRALRPDRLSLELAESAQLRRHWKHLMAQVNSKGGKKGSKSAATEVASSREKGSEPAADAVEEEKAEGAGKKRKSAVANPKKKKKGAKAAAAPVEDAEGNAAQDDAADGSPAAKKRKTDAAAAADSAGWVVGAQMPRYEWSFVPSLLRELLHEVESCPGPGQGEIPAGLLSYIERFMELLIDLLCQLPTRRFLRALLEDMHLGVRLSLSGLAKRGIAAAAAADSPDLPIRKPRGDGESDDDGKLFVQLLTMYRFYLGFEIDDRKGAPLTQLDMMQRHHRRVHALQAMAYKRYKDVLPNLPFASVQALGKRPALEEALSPLPVELLAEIAWRLHLLPAPANSSSGGSGSAEDGMDVDGGEGEEASGVVADAAVPDDGLSAWLGNKEFLLEVLYEHLAERVSQIQQINETSLFPNERLLWDANQVPLGQYYGGRVMALPKLNLQFLTFHDYLLRSFNLFRLESAYEIREDMADAIRRVSAAPDVTGQGVRFQGWARMAVPVGGFSITDVKKPELGETVPSQVRAEIRYTVAQFSGMIRQEWDELREHDVVFLVVLKPVAAADLQAMDDANGHGNGNGQQSSNAAFQRAAGGGGGGNNAAGGRGKNKGGSGFGASRRDLEDPMFPVRYGVVAVRGAEVVETRDEENQLMNDPLQRPHERGPPKGNRRTLRVLMDAAQYQEDMKAGNNCYDEFNLLVRRKAKENNFKGVLETIRDLMNTAAVGKAVPPWLHDVFLGYGDPAGAHYRRLPDLTQKKAVDFADTFLDSTHVAEAFPTAAVRFVDEAGERLPPAVAAPPYRLTFEEKGAKGAGGADVELVRVQPYKPPPPGPYPEDVPKMNTVRFTPVQTEAIRSGMSAGLTMVVGPPGTGKTDVAVQTISNLYRAFPTQRTLVVAHSNAALNDLFEKIMQRDVDERHLLRLGAGEKELRAGVAKDFSKWGRVNYTLARRLQLLAEVDRLAGALKVEGDVGYTCETAAYFRLHHVVSREEKFEADVASAVAAALAAGEKAPPAKSVAELFPFTDFFATAPVQPVFRQESFAGDMEAAQGCLRHLRRLFEELEDYRAFELLRSHSARADYLLTKQARIVAMTCTHAALVRRRLVELGFKYDNLVMEESAQILEVETFIPMLLQDLDPVEGCRLKRVMLIGDHNQLPPVVKSMAFQKYARLDQSLFTRFVRLGTPTVQLNAQGRARPPIAALYNWRYTGLGDLSNVSSTAYKYANAGFAYDYQLIDVQDFQGRGESAPTPHFYQNLGEAEYVVAVYQYMRLLGYPAEKISILTTYNGQKALIRDVLQQRCAANPALFGLPADVATVDKFQGQQNDYILLSLVRTRAVGHLRDVRRLVVAMSRARLGLYVFCRQSLFENCYELSPTFSKLLQRPPHLRLLLNEPWPSQRPTSPLKPLPVLPYDVFNVTQMGVLVHQMATSAISRQLGALQQQEEWEKAAAAASEAAAVAAEMEIAAEEVEAQEGELAADDGGDGGVAAEEEAAGDETEPMEQEAEEDGGANNDNDEEKGEGGDDAEEGGAGDEEDA